MQAVGNTTLQIEPLGSVTLRIEITSNGFAQRYLRALMWYHDGNQVSNTSNGRITVSSDNTTLKIREISEDDAGIYEVKFAGLLIYPYSEFCEQETLALLRHYPALAPATFYVQTDGKIKSKFIACLSFKVTLINILQYL